eukprot:6767723-Lingulodinium_polyedra.AAC.1
MRAVVAADSDRNRAIVAFSNATILRLRFLSAVAADRISHATRAPCEHHFWCSRGFEHQNG